MLVLHQREPRPSTMLMVQTIGVAPSQRCAPASFLRRNVVSASGAAAVPALATSTAPAAARAAVVPCAADAALQQQAYGCSTEIRAGSKNVLHPASPEDAEAWRRQATGSTTGRKASRQSRGPEESIPSAWAQDLELSAEEPLLGGGAFAKILRVVERSSGKMYAMKVMNRPNFAMRGIEGQIDAEIEAMRRCLKNRWTRHVVRFHDATEDNDHVYIKLELCHCDLLRLANNQPGNRLKENDAMVWTRQLLLGLRDLHCVGILHRDIKPENLLCAFDGTLKIADLGWCADLRDAPSSLAGTFQYMAPEILGHQGVQTEAVDVWSAGVTVMQLVTGRQMLMTYLGPGATGLTMMDPHQATKVKTSRLAAEIYDRCPPTDEQRLAANLSWRCWDLIRRMLMPEVAMRVSAAEALGHSWLQEAPDHDDDSDALASPSAVATAPLDSPMFSAAAPPSQFERATNGAAALAADQGSSSSSFATSHVSAVATAPGSSPAKTYKAVALNAAATITSNLNSVTGQRGTASQSTSTGGGLSSCSSVPALEVPTQARALTPRKMSSATATQSSAAAALGATTPAGSSIIISAATAANVAANVAATAAAAAKAKAKSHSPRRRPNQQLHSSQARLVTPTPHARCRRSETAPTSLQVRDIGLAPTLSPRRMQSDGVDDSSSGPRQVCRSRSARISETWTSTIDSVGIETLDSIGSRVLVHQEPDKRVTSILRSVRRQSAPSRPSEVRLDASMVRSVTVRPRRRELSPRASGVAAPGRASNANVAASTATIAPLTPAASTAIMEGLITRDALSITVPPDLLKANAVAAVCGTNVRRAGVVVRGRQGVSLQSVSSGTGHRLSQAYPVAAGCSSSVSPAMQVVSSGAAAVASSAPMPAVDQRCRLSPRPYVSPFNAFRGSTVTVAAASPPATPVPTKSPDKTFQFRDILLPARRVATAGSTAGRALF